MAKSSNPTDRRIQAAECAVTRAAERLAVASAAAETARTRLTGAESLPPICSSKRARTAAISRRERAAMSYTKADQRRTRAMEAHEDARRKLADLYARAGRESSSTSSTRFVGNDALVVIPSAKGTPTRLPARFVLVDAESIIPSHDATSFSPRPDYPANVQERQYDRDPAEQLKVQDVARNLVPELVQNTNAGAIDGTPIVDEAGIVISGNGRTMGVQRHYRRKLQPTEDPRSAYLLRSWLLRNAAQFGFTRAQVDQLSRPLVVREIAVSSGQRARLVRDTNESLTQRMTAGAEAEAKARQLPPDLLDVLRDSEADKLEPSKYLSSSASSRLVGALERSGFINRSNRSRLLDAGGTFSREAGGELLALMSRAVVPGELTTATRTMVDRSSLAWLVAAAAGPQWDLREDLAAAFSEYLQLKNACLAQWREQRGFDERPTDRKPIARLLLELITLTARRPNVFASIARHYAAHSRSGGAGLFGGGLSPIDALRDAALDNKVEPTDAESRKYCSKKKRSKKK